MNREIEKFSEHKNNVSIYGFLRKYSVAKLFEPINEIFKHPRHSYVTRQISKHEIHFSNIDFLEKLNNLCQNNQPSFLLILCESPGDKDA